MEDIKRLENQIKNLEQSNNDMLKTLQHREKMFDALANGWEFLFSVGHPLKLGNSQKCLSYGSLEYGIFAVVEPMLGEVK